MEFDDNEIEARNNGAASTLYISADGGTTSLNQGGGKVGIGTDIPTKGTLEIDDSSRTSSKWISCTVMC